MEAIDDSETGNIYYVGNEIDPEIQGGLGTENHYLGAHDYADHLVPTTALLPRRRTLESVEPGVMVWFDATNDPSNQGLFVLQNDYTWSRASTLPVGTDIRNLTVSFSHFRGQSCYVQSQTVEFIYPDNSSPIRVGIDNIHRLYKTSFNTFTNLDGTEIMRPFQKNNPIRKSGYRQYFKYNAGATATRPDANNVYNGFMFFDTTLDIPLWFNKDEWNSPYIRIFGSFFSTSTQYSNKAKSPITFSNTVATYRTTLMENNSDVKVLEHGYYIVMINAQCQKIVGSGTAYDINMWLNINGTDVPYSTRSVHLETPGVYRQLTLSMVLHMNAGDRVQAFTNSGANGRNSLVHTANNATTPAVPSVTMYIQRVSRE